MNAAHEPTQEQIDADLELRIEAAYQAGIHAEDPESAREAFFAMGALIAQRSPQQVAKMEARLPEPWRS